VLQFKVVPAFQPVAKEQVREFNARCTTLKVIHSFDAAAEPDQRVICMCACMRYGRIPQGCTQNAFRVPAEYIFKERRKKTPASRKQS
jgi:hypothetical protein